MFIKYWNKKISGLPHFLFVLINVVIIKIFEIILSKIYAFSFDTCGKQFSIQKGTVIRYPGNISIGKNVSIGRNVEVFSESKNGRMIIGNNSDINKNCQIDFTGNLEIGSNVVISETTVVLTHDHGYNPRSEPIRSSLIIEDNVWIGQNVMILPNVKRIGHNSIVAAGSIVTKEVPKKCIVAGNPAKIIKRL